VTLITEEYGALHRFFKPAATIAHLVDAGMSARSAQVKAGLFTDAARTLHNAGATTQAGDRHLRARPHRGHGKHTDYCGGRSLLMTTERGMCFVAIPRPDPVIRMFDVSNGREIQFPFSAGLEPTSVTVKLPMTVARRGRRNFPGPLRGCDIAMASDLPPPRGSAAAVR